MCIAILKPKDKTISKEILEACHSRNKDGIGFAYVNNGKVIIKKFMDFDKFYKEYLDVEGISNMLIHFRIATHGNVEVNNCHPFKLNDRMALIHNGIISGYGSKTDNKVDTQDFIDKVIGKISYKMWKNPSYRELVGDAIGYSKFCILDNQDNYYIINEKKGSWVDGIWYSNDSYKPRKKEVVIAPAKKSEQKSLFNYITRCQKCGKIVKTNSWWQDDCPKCKGKLECIGYINNGNEIYYDDEDNKKQRLNKIYNNKYNWYDEEEYYNRYNCGEFYGLNY